MSQLTLPLTYSTVGIKIIQYNQGQNSCLYLNYWQENAGIYMFSIILKATEAEALKLSHHLLISYLLVILIFQLFVCLPFSTAPSPPFNISRTFPSIPSWLPCGALNKWYYNFSCLFWVKSLCRVSGPYYSSIIDFIRLENVCICA